MGLPQMGHCSPLVFSSSSLIFAASSGIGWVTLLPSSGQAKNFPMRPYFINIVLPQCGQGVVETSICFSTLSSFSFKCLFKWTVKFFHYFHPFYFAFGNVIKLFFNVGSKINIHDFRKIFHQHIVDQKAFFGGGVFLFFFVYIAAFLDGSQSWRVSGRAADAVWLPKL